MSSWTYRVASCGIETKPAEAQTSSRETRLVKWCRSLAIGRECLGNAYAVVSVGSCSKAWFMSWRQMGLKVPARSLAGVVMDQT